MAATRRSPALPAFRREDAVPARQKFSHSRLTLLDQCPRQYRFRYVERRREAFRSVESFCGTLVHDALGWAYREREERRTPTLAEVVEHLRELWRERLSPAVRVVRDPVAGEPTDETARREAHREDAETVLRTHLEGAFTRDRRETIAIEQHVRLTIDDHSYIGYVDRLCRDADGTLHVVDFKTARRIPEDGRVADEQVRGYGVALLESHGGAEVALELDYLRHDHQVTARVSREEVPSVAASIARRIDATLEAERAGEFPARPSPLCRWCGYREDCDASPFHAGPKPEPIGADPGPCPDCGQALRLRHGRRGAFVGCSGYPDCRHARDARPEELPPKRGDGETTCPLCGAELARRSGRRGDFLGCSAYPSCRFTRDVPAEGA